jgi:hypothetical protein
MSVLIYIRQSILILKPKSALGMKGQPTNTADRDNHAGCLGNRFVTTLNTPEKSRMLFLLVSCQRLYPLRHTRTYLHLFRDTKGSCFPFLKL